MFQLSASAINHLLAQNSWAAPRLQRFAGKTARFNIVPFSFVYTVQADGMVQAGAANATPDAECDIAPSLLPRLALQDEAAFAQIRTSGDAGLLTEIFYLSRHLRWDAAEDLSHVTGDVAAERLVQTAASNATPDAECDIAPSLLPRLALQDEAAFAQIRTSGDAGLLTEIFYLSRHLRWDAAEDLSRVTGDVAAERLVQLARAKRQQVRDTAVNLSQAAAEYWTEEHPLLAKPAQVTEFISQVDKLRDDVARLEYRLNRLTKK